VRPLRGLAQQLAHRLLGSPQMAASLAMRRSVLSMPSMQYVAGRQLQSEVSLGQEQPGWGLVERLHAYLQPLLGMLRGRWQLSQEEVSCIMHAKHTGLSSMRVLSVCHDMACRWLMPVCT
jgi:hypothetical protein